MRALVSDGRGSVTSSGVAAPEPASGQVIVAVEAISINRGETFQLENPAPGWRPGKDFAGTVMRAATDGKGPSVGDRVVGHAPHSAWADQVAVDADRLVALPDELPSEVAAALPLAGLTALRLARRAALGPGSTLLMTGASGGVGHYIAELAAMTAAHLTAVVGTWERGAGLRDLGATTVTDLADAGTGYDVGLDSVGGDSLGRVRSRVRPDGRVIWFGQASRNPAVLDFFDWVDGTAGAPILQFSYEADDRPLRRDLGTLVDLTARGLLRPALDRVRSIADAGVAIDDLRQRRILGNLVVAWR